MARSIIDIDVNDESFKAFLSLFQQYRDEVKAMPGAWGEAETVVESVGAGFAAMTAALLTQARLMKQQTEEREKLNKDTAEATRGAVEGSEKLNRSEENRARIVHRIVDDTRAITRNVLETTNSLLQWIGIGSIFSGLMGAGGLWGLDHMARDVSDSRRNATGLGLNIGQLRSFSTNFQGFLDSPTGMLQNVMEARQNYGNRWAFSAAGVNPNMGQSNTDLAIQLMEAAKRWFERSDHSQQSAQATGLLQFFTMADLNRIGRMSRDELRRTEASYGRDARSLNIPDPLARDWQQLHIQLSRSGQMIEAAFVVGLRPLLPAFDHFSSALANTIQTLLANPHMREWIEGVGHGLEQLAHYLDTPQFQRDVNTWMNNIGRFVDEFGQLMGFVERWLVRMGIIAPSLANNGSVSVGAPGSHFNLRDAVGLGIPQLLDPNGRAHIGPAAPVGTVNQQSAMAFFAGRGWTRAQAAGLVANIQHESSFNPSVGDYAGLGHYGIAQWSRERQRDYVNIFHHTMQSVHDRNQALLEQMTFMDWELRNGRYRSVGEQLQNATGAGQAAGLIATQYERPYSGQRMIDEAQTRARTANALVTVNIHNQTGAHVGVTTQQLAH